MPEIKPIRDLRNTSEISELAHRVQEPIFITKNGYSDLVVMSAELYDRFVSILKVDMAIFEAETELENGAVTLDAKKALETIEKRRTKDE